MPALISAAPASSVSQSARAAPRPARSRLSRPLPRGPTTSSGFSPCSAATSCSTSASRPVVGEQRRGELAALAREPRPARSGAARAVTCGDRDQLLELGRRRARARGRGRSPRRPGRAAPGPSARARRRGASTIAFSASRPAPRHSAPGVREHRLRRARSRRDGRARAAGTRRAARAACPAVRAGRPRAAGRAARRCSASSATQPATTSPPARASRVASSNASASATARWNVSLASSASARRWDLGSARSVSSAASSSFTAARRAPDRALARPPLPGRARRAGRTRWARAARRRGG